MSRLGKLLTPAHQVIHGLTGEPFAYGGSQQGADGKPLYGDFPEVDIDPIIREQIGHVSIPSFRLEALKSQIPEKPVAYGPKRIRRLDTLQDFEIVKVREVGTHWIMDLKGL